MIDKTIQHYDIDIREGMIKNAEKNFKRGGVKLRQN